MKSTRSEFKSHLAPLTAEAFTRPVESKDSLEERAALLKKISRNP